MLFDIIFSIFVMRVKRKEQKMQIRLFFFSSFFLGRVKNVIFLQSFKDEFLFLLRLCLV